MKKSLAMFTALSLSLAASACTHNQGNNESYSYNNSGPMQQEKGSMSDHEWQHQGWSEQDHVRMMHMMANAMFDGMDKNHDGIVTRKEYEEYSRNWFRQADANHDGKLTRDEFIAQLHREKKLLMHRISHEEGEGSNDMNDEGDNNEK